MQDFWKGLTTLGKIKFVSYCLLGIFSVLFVVFNWTEVNVDFVFLKRKIPVSLVIMLSMACGYAISMLFSYKKTRIKEKEANQLRQQMNQPNASNTDV